MNRRAAGERGSTRRANLRAFSLPIQKQSPPILKKVPNNWVLLVRELM